MNLPRPTTLLQLVLIAFGLVALPLIAAIITAIVQVDRLAQRSWTAVVNAEQTTKAAQGLVDQITAMERSARQFLVLGDRALYERYLDSRSEFERSAELVKWLDTDGAVSQALDELILKERRMYGGLSAVSKSWSSLERQPDLDPAFSDLSATARNVVTEGSQRIWDQANAMSSDAASLKQLLVWEAAALVPTTVALVVLFTVLINRPLRHIGRAIRRIGDGELAREVEVRGPRDLEELGKRLDWLRSRLAELEAQKTAFMQHVSHELKTPLTAIREGAELLVDHAPATQSSERADIVRIIRESAIQLHQLIDNLLKISAAGNPVAPPKREVVVLDKLVKRVLSDHELAAGSKALGIEYRPSMLKFRGDRERLRVVLDNLVSNAVKYSPREGIIRIGAHEADGWVVLDVIDAGPGIAPEERDSVLEPFHQGKSTPTGFVKGTGLGLAIVAEYVRSHDGEISILDTNGGAHVQVRIPSSKP